MGHLINPVSFRLGVNRVWNHNLTNFNSKSKNSLNLMNLNLNSFLERFFNFKVFLKHGLLYSHHNLITTNKGLVVNVYIYKTIYTLEDVTQKNLIFFLLKIFDEKIRLKLYQEVITNLELYFSEVNNKFLTDKKSFNRKNINYLYSIFQLKKTQFLTIEQFFKHLLDKNLRNNDFLDQFFEKLFMNLIRKRFWKILSTFIYFYIKTFLPKIASINFYNTNELTIDIIKKYIIIRLQQRFKVSQIITPIIRNLKDNKNILGFKFAFSGRFSRREMATYEWFVEGKVPLNTINSKIEYKQFPILLKDGICGIKIWVTRADDFENDNFTLIDSFGSNHIEKLIYKS